FACHQNFRATGTVCARPSDEIQTAATFGNLFTRSRPFAGPISNKAVERASEAVADSATTLTAVAESRGSPATASMMCPNEGIPSKLGGVCCEVETLFSFNKT